MANRISVLIDVVSEKASKSVNSFKMAVNEADGALGKLKAGGASAFASLKANSAMASAALVGVLAVGFKKSIDAASSLEESMNAVDVTFGDAARGIHKLGETSAESFGLSQAAFNGAAVSFSAFAEQVAGPGGDVVDVMGDLMTRAVDFASVMDLDLNEAMQVFQSTLAGQTEPIRKYGKDVSAAAVTQYALANSLVGSKSEMTEAIKVQARYGLLMEQTADTANDFANTSDSLANQQRILGANMENTAATFGEVFTPAVAKAAEGANFLAKSMEFLFKDAPTQFGNFVQTIFNRDALAARRASEAFQEVEASAGEYYDSATKGATSVEEVRAKAEALGLDLHAVNLITVEWSRSNGIATSALDENAEATEGLGGAVVDLDRNVQALTKAQKENTEATRDAREERHRTASATLDARDAEDAFFDSVEASTEALEDAELTDREKAASVRDVVRATDEMIVKQLEEQGVLLDTERGQKAYTDSMVDTAMFMGGPMGAEILAHVARVNGIPDEKVTEIQAQIDAGNVATARRMIDTELSKAEALVTVTPVGLEAAQARIEAILGRTITISADTYTPGGGNGLEWEQLGEDLGDGVALGIEGSVGRVARAADGLVTAALGSAKTVARVKSPSRLFAEEVGQPIAAGVAEGIADDAHKVSEALVESIEDAEESAVAAADELTENVLASFDALAEGAADRLSSIWDGIDDARSLAGIEESVSDAEESLSDASVNVVDANKNMTDAQYALALAQASGTATAEEMAKLIEAERKAVEEASDAIEAKNDATTRLQDANLRLTKATMDNIVGTDAQREAWLLAAAGAGLTAIQVRDLESAYRSAAEAQAALAAATILQNQFAAESVAAVNAEATAAKATNDLFNQLGQQGLLQGDDFTRVAALSSSPAQQLALMTQIIARVERFFAAIQPQGRAASPAVDTSAIAAAVSAGMVQGFKGIRQNERAQ